jgi:hypothetical protein
MRYGVLVILLASLTLTSCMFGSDRQKAESIMQGYYSKLETNDVQGLLPLFSDAFFQETSRVDYVKLMANIRAKVGAYKSSSLSSWNVNARLGTGGGKYVTLVYKVVYEKAEVTETFVLFQPAGSNNMQIQSYDFRFNRPLEDGSEPSGKAKDNGNA